MPAAEMFARECERCCCRALICFNRSFNRSVPIPNIRAIRSIIWSVLSIAIATSLGNHAQHRVDRRGDRVRVACDVNTAGQPTEFVVQSIGSSSTRAWNASRP